MDRNLNGQSPSQHPRTGLLPMDGGAKFGLGVLVAAFCAVMVAAVLPLGDALEVAIHGAARFASVAVLATFAFRYSAHKVRVLLAGALLAGGLTVGFGAVTGAAVLCGPGETFDKGRCVRDEPDEARRETRDVNDQRTTTTVRPIRTIREGQSTTFTAPNPQNRQEFFCRPKRTTHHYEPNLNEHGVDLGGTTTTTTQRAQAIYLPSGTERTTDEPFTCGDGKYRRTYGICRGPYTLEIATRDSRVAISSGLRLRVATDASDNLDDTGSVDVVYYLHGTRTKVSAQSNDRPDVTTTEECTLRETTRVQVNPARRPGMTAAVAKHSPSDAWINDTTTVNWTCDQALLDHLVAESIPAYCDLGDEVETTTDNEWRTPRGCVIVVTVSDRGHGSTGCVTNDQAANIGDVKGYDHSDLPTCPDPLPPDKGYRCVARN